MVMIWGTAARTGTSLLQRLIKSSGKIFCYGENAFVTRLFPEFAELVAGRDASDRETFLKNTNFGWSPNVWPRKDVHHKGIIAAMKTYIIAAYGNDSPYIDFALKEPMFNKNKFIIFNECIPDIKHIIINRNFRDILKSHKARKWIKSVDDINDLGMQWAGSQDPPDGMFRIQYEKLVLRPRDYIPSLESFLDITVDYSVMKKKFNTFSTQARSQYVKPAALTQDEEVIARHWGNYFRSW